MGSIEYIVVENEEAGEIVILSIGVRGDALALDVGKMKNVIVDVANEIWEV